METGGTDGVHLRPAGIAFLVESFHEGVEFYDRLARTLSTAIE